MFKKQTLKAQIVAQKAINFGKHNLDIVAQKRAEIEEKLAERKALKDDEIVSLEIELAHLKAAS